jgi:hypothetical protein
MGPCRFYKKGHCKKGKDCEFQHLDESGTPARRSPTGSRPTRRGRKGKKDRKARDRSNSPATRGRSPDKKKKKDKKKSHDKKSSSGSSRSSGGKNKKKKNDKKKASVAIALPVPVDMTEMSPAEEHTYAENIRNAVANLRDGNRWQDWDEIGRHP